MKLSGRLSVARLEEDNPLKAYFRIKPLIVTEQDTIELFTEGEESFPADGCIRIVPDKNEMNMFKSRMHMMGSFAVLDLRKYPGENEKIRPNKNYENNGSDRNAYIVYSDVVLAPAAGLITQVIDVTEQPGETMAAAVPEPLTPFVALRCSGSCCGPYKWRQSEGSVVFEAASASEWKWKDINEPAGICLTIENDITVYINIAALDAETQTDTVSAPSPKVSAPSHAAVEVQPVEKVSENAAETQEEQLKEDELSYSSHRAINARITMREQALLAQMGINPRRGRSLYQIVDEKWRKSRIDQLGHPVPLEAMGLPADDPVENAMTSIRAVMSMPEARSSLIEEMLRNETLSDALGTVFGASKKKDNANDGSLTELESEKLRLSAEIDALKNRREAERTMIMNELRTQYASEIAGLEEKKTVLKNDIDKLHETETGARYAAKQAVEAMEKITDEEVDGRLKEHILASHTAELMKGLNGEFTIAPKKPVTVSPTAGELISDVRAYFERAGKIMDNDTAVNALACLTLEKGMLLSGPVGSGKRDFVRLLAGALGILNPEYSRYYMTSEMELLKKTLQEEKLVSDDETVTIASMIGFNGSYCDNNLASLANFNEKSFGNGLRFIMIINDAPDGHPVAAGTYDRSFTLRLANQGADTPWKPAAGRPVVYGQAVSLEKLKEIFTPKNDLPVEMEMRMTALREQLDKLDTPLTRRTLDATWRYCSAVLPYMQCSPLEILDIALSQRGLPTLLASMPPAALIKLPEIFKDMKHCMDVIDAPMPLPALY